MTIRSTEQRAHSWAITHCGFCPNAHVLLKDKDGEIFAGFTVGPYQIDEFTNGLVKACSDARRDNLRKQSDTEDPYGNDSHGKPPGVS